MEQLVALPAGDSFSALLRACRLRAGLSQEALAARSGLSERTVRNLEADRVRAPRSDTTRLLADVLELAGPEREAFASAARRDMTQRWQGSTPMAKTSGADSPVGLPPDPPAQLPLDVRGFTGRGDELDRLDALLAQTADQPTAVVVALSGTAGVGKTALAVHWAHRVADRFPDGQLYVNLRGFHPNGSAMEPAEAVRGFLDAFAVPPQRIPTTLTAQAALYRSLLAGRRVLVVLDNASAADQVRPLLPSNPTALVVVTSRNQLTGLVAVEGAHPLTLDLLTRDEAHELLARRLGADRVAAEPGAVDEIITRCARLPLALTIVAARAAIHPDFPLAVLAAELLDTPGRLDALGDPDALADVRAAFSLSYHTLNTDAARLFRQLSLHPGPDISAPAAGSLSGVPIRRGRRLLAELTHANLISEHRSGRYTFHDLLRAYATELTHALDSDTQRLAASRRMLDHYLHTAHTAARQLHPCRDPITPAPPQSGVTAEDLPSHERALDWFAVEHATLLAIIDEAASGGFDMHTWQLAWTLADYLDRRGHWHDCAATQGVALEAAQRLVDLAAQAYAHRGLAGALARLGRLDDAHTHYRQALALSGELGDHTAQAHVHLLLAWISELGGNNHEALNHAQRALDLSEVTGDPTWRALALNMVGWYHALLGDHQRALNHCQQALNLQQTFRDRFGEAGTWDSLGYAHHHLGNHQQAIVCYQHAIDLRRELGDLYHEAATLARLGDVHHAAGDPDTGRNAWQRALNILDELGHPDADHIRTKLCQTHCRADV